MGAGYRRVLQKPRRQLTKTPTSSTATAALFPEISEVTPTNETEWSKIDKTVDVRRKEDYNLVRSFVPDEIIMSGEVNLYHPDHGELKQIENLKYIPHKEFIAQHPSPDQLGSVTKIKIATSS